MEIWIVSFILLAVIYLLISEKLSVDVTGLGIIAVLSLTKILLPVEAVAGFANPAVITVAAMFIISKGMIRTGAVELLTDRVIYMTKGSPVKAMILLILMGAIASAFINNTPIVVLFIPVIMSMCCQFNLSPSKYLIPMSYASILAGTCTLIGTSTNIIVSDLSAKYGYGSFNMFELARVGFPLAIIGMIFLALISSKLLPNNLNPACELEHSGPKKYLTELKVNQESRFIGSLSDKLIAKDYPDLEIIEIIRSSRIFYPSRDKIKIAKDDHLLIKGGVNDLVALVQEQGLELPYLEKNKDIKQQEQEKIIVEVIIPPQSSLINERLGEVFLFHDPNFHIIAVQRSGLHYMERKIPDIKLKIGDIILINLSLKKLEELRSKTDIIVIEDIHHKIVNKSKAQIAGLIFLSMVILASTGILNIMVSALAAVFLMIVTKCLQIRDAYQALQGDVLVLIAGTIALGSAMEKTGASHLYAEYFLNLFSNLPPVFILGAFILLTSISTQILSNNATAVLLLPIAISTALEIGASPKPFIIGVCIGASACFATPIGYQTNLLVYGPGGYRFTDFMKLGIPLNIMIITAGAFLIPLFWPF